MDQFFWEFNLQSRWSGMRRTRNFANIGAQNAKQYSGTAENIILVSTKNAFDNFGEEIMTSVDEKKNGKKFNHHYGLNQM